jgi:hypothetical protein
MFTFATPFFYIGLGSEIRDPGSGMNKYSDPGSGIKHPGSATLIRSRLGPVKNNFLHMPDLIFTIKK